MAPVYFNSYIDPNAGLDPNLSIYNNPYLSLQNIPQQQPQQSAAGGIANKAGQLGGMYLGGKAAGLGAGISSAPPVAALPAISTPSNAATMEALNLADAGASPASAGIGVTPYIGAAGALAGAYGLGKGIQAHDRKTSAIGGAALGGGLAAAAPLLGFGPVGWGALALATLGGGTLGGLAGHITGGKSKDQQARDKARGALQEAGIADDKFMVSGLDIGKDGGAMLTNVGENIDGKKERHYYDVDFSNPLAKASVTKVDPYVKALLGEGAGDKLKSDTTGMLINALTNNAKTQSDVDKRIASMFKGISLPKGSSGISSAPPRSKTKSPGISKDGRRISY